MKIVWISVVACCLGLALFAFTFYQRTVDVNEANRQAEQTNTALCTFKEDLQHRYVNGVRFLLEHPDGIPGISRADINRSLSNQKATLDSLSELECE